MSQDGKDGKGGKGGKDGKVEGGNLIPSATRDLLRRLRELAK
jgi:hypothetical protein